MKKEDVRNLTIWAIFAVLLFFGAVISLTIHIKDNLDYYVTYSENSDIDYRVYLKKNDYFENKYLGKNTKYIASIIDYIETNFSYKLFFPNNNINYKYLYKIMAEIKVKDKDDDITYYEYREELFNSAALETKGSITINKKINVDYNKYNDLISGFVNDFDLDRSESSLRITMKVMLLDNENEYLKSIDSNRTISLNVPLTTKTISIGLSSDLSNNNNNKIHVSREGKDPLFLLTGIICMITSLIIGLYIIIYYRKNRTPLAIYRKKLKSILNNYSSYIQEIDNSHKIGASVVYKLKTFEDLMEVRDTIQKPILMIHNSKNTGTFFIIPANEYTIYSYAIRVVDIVANKNGLETPDYDVKNFSKETLAERKFTKQYIDSQIDEATKTIIMNKLDIDNTIIGNKDSNENIYEQLEKTTSYKIDDLEEYTKKSSKKSIKKEKEEDVKIEKPKRGRKPKKKEEKAEDSEKWVL